MPLSEERPFASVMLITRSPTLQSLALTLLTAPVKGKSRLLTHRKFHGFLPFYYPNSTFNDENGAGNSLNGIIQAPPTLNLLQESIRPERDLYPRSVRSINLSYPQYIMLNAPQISVLIFMQSLKEKLLCTCSQNV